MKPRILLVYKRSTYEYLEPFGFSAKKESRRFFSSHKRHYMTLKRIENFLRQEHVPFTKICRGGQISDNTFDIVITIGGDGTFLEAAHAIEKQIILGVNSDPRWSVGRFCAAKPDNFPEVFHALMQGKAPLIDIHRFELSLNKKRLPIRALNDVLICHKNPAAMSHYYLHLGRTREEQRSSGVWVATAAGSTGAIRSGGGRPSPLDSRKFQYLPRELYLGWKTRARLSGGFIRPPQRLQIGSLMRDGVFFIDGAHLQFPFPFGHTLLIQISRQPLKTVRPINR